MTKLFGLNLSEEKFAFGDKIGFNMKLSGDCISKNL